MRRLLIAIVLAGALAYQGITYTKSEKVLEVGPITATKETKKTIPLPPVLGGKLSLTSKIVMALRLRGAVGRCGVRGPVRPGGGGGYWSSAPGRAPACTLGQTCGR